MLGTKKIYLENVPKKRSVIEILFSGHFRNKFSLSLALMSF